MTGPTGPTGLIGSTGPTGPGVTLTAGDGLTGGGVLNVNRTIAVDSTVVRTSGDQAISGVKTFSSGLVAGSGGQTWQIESGDNLLFRSGTAPTTRMTLTSAGDLTISGGLTVNGTTTTINATTLTVGDKNIEIGKVTTPTDVTASGGGITLLGATNKTII